MQPMSLGNAQLTFAKEVRSLSALTTTTPNATLATHRSLQRLVKWCARNPTLAGQDSKVMLDLTRCQSMDLGGLLLYMYADRRVRDLGFALWYRVRTRSPVYEFLQRHLESWRAGRGAFTVTGTTGTAFLLREITSPAVMVADVTQWAAAVRAETGASRHDMARWEQTIAEVVMNAAHHGGNGPDDDPVLVCGDLAGDVMEFAVLDLGQGIPNTIAKVAPPEVGQRAGRLIRYACQPGITCKSRRSNQGHGLASLVTAVQSSRGTLQVLSHNALAHIPPPASSARTSRLYGRTLQPDSNGAPTLRGTLTLIRHRIGTP